MSAIIAKLLRALMFSVINMSNYCNKIYGIFDQIIHVRCLLLFIQTLSAWNHLSKIPPVLIRDYLGAVSRRKTVLTRYGNSYVKDKDVPNDPSYL